VTAVPHMSATATATAPATCATAARVAVPLAAVIPRGRHGRAAGRQRRLQRAGGAHRVLYATRGTRAGLC
jgi:hypothetical protein